MIQQLNKICSGWKESANGMLTSAHEKGAIIDQNYVSNTWFIIFNDDREPLEGFNSRIDAFNTFVEMSR